MPPKVFQPGQYREVVKQALREGVSVEECLKRWPVPERTVYSYQKEVRDEQAGKTPAEEKTAKLQVPETGVSKKAFTPAGTPTSPPPPPPAKEYVYVGPIRMPVLDLGFSSSRNLFIVADTFEIAKQEYSFPETMKVGDFLAQLCQAFRMMRGWDVIGAGVFPVKIENEVEKEVKVQ